LDYPLSGRDEVVDLLHGVEVADPYRWLEELDSDNTRAWIEAQNALTFGFLAKLPKRATLAERLTRLWDYPKHGVPFRRGDRYFVTYNDGLQNQGVLYWMDSPDGEMRVLLDPNALTDDGTMALTGYSPTEDGKLLAYGVSDAGSDWQEWRVRDVETGEDLDDHIAWVKFSGASWLKDSSGLFYSRYDEPVDGDALKNANYNQKLYFHKLGTPQSEDELVYERPDEPEWGFGGHVTHDGRYLIITVWRGTHRENGLFFRDLTDPDADVVELLSAFDAGYHFIGNSGSVFYMSTDLDAPMSRLIAIDVTEPATIREVIPESDDSLLFVSFIGGKFLVTYLHDAYSVVRVFAEDGTYERDVDLPGLGTHGGFSGRPEDREAYYVYTSFTVPNIIFHYDIDSGVSTLYRQPDVDFDPDQFVAEQVFYQSKDGTRVPMFICRRKDVELGPDTPCYLYGYGGFDIPSMPAFNVSTLVWMEQGGVYAQACIRGGGEYGKAWHEAGTKLTKQNCFDDFIAAAEWLIENGYTSTPKLAIGGGSNGGLLVGACLTQRPDLFGAAVPAVGVLDMLRFHKFTIGWGWTSDYGSPDDPDEFKALLAYSPLHNVRPGTHYPATLVTTGDHDDRVFPAHSFKFAASLQHAQAGDAPTLIRVETRAGHGAGKPTAKVIEEQADRWAFILDALGVV